MSRSPTVIDDDNLSIALSDLVQFDQPDEEIADQEIQNQLQQELPQFGPKGIAWSGRKTRASISKYGLKAANVGFLGQYVFATEGYPISVEQCRKDNFPFPETIVFYFEVTTYGWPRWVGFSDGNDGFFDSTNSYAIRRNGSYFNEYWLSGKQHKFEHPVVLAVRDVVGSGLLLKSTNELAVFFTLNGKLLGKPTPINPTVDRLYPTVRIAEASVVANFGDNLGVKPFKFDVDNCPGLV